MTRKYHIHTLQTNPLQLEEEQHNSHKISGRQYEPRHEISNNVACATSKASDQPLLVALIFYDC